MTDTLDTSRAAGEWQGCEHCGCCLRCANCNTKVMAPPPALQDVLGEQVAALLDEAGATIARANGTTSIVYRLHQALREIRDFAMWQPIQTAPKDGRYILLAGPSGYNTTPLRVEVCRYDPEFRPLQPWVNHSNDSFLDGGCAPTLWMPLPAAPAIEFES